MKLIRSIFIVLVVLGTNLYSLEKEESVNINFKNLSIMKLVDLTSKILDKNILITKNIPGKVDFISNKPLFKNDIVNILTYVLESKGYALIQSDGILRIVRLSDSSKYNVPVIFGKNTTYHFQMVTEIFNVNNANVDYIASKIRHLISKTAKLVTDKETNSIVVTDFQNNIKTIKKVISLITRSTNKQIEVVSLKNIQASIAKLSLDTISKAMFNFKVEKEKITILVNKENNALTIVGSKKNVTYLKDYIVNMDKKGNIVKRVVEVIALKNAESQDVIKIINSIIGKKKYIDPNAKPFASSDDSSNAIVLMGPQDEIAYMKELISKLDKEKLQVYVKARVIEVNNDLISEIGIKYGLLGSKINSSGLGTFASTLNGGSALAFKPESIGLNIPNLTSGLALGAAISLLNQNSALDIVSEPSILSTNNKESLIYVGETVSIKTGTTTNSTGTSSSFKREDIGLTLKIKPRISNANKVTLEINTILEDVLDHTTDSGNADTLKKEIKTTAIVNNGESVIIGGLVQKKNLSTVHKIPLLGDIPLIGRLFSYKRGIIKKRNLVIIVTPYIIPKSKDLTYVRNQLAELKMLETKFLEDKLIRLRKKQIDAKINRQEKSDELADLNEEYEELNDISEEEKIQNEIFNKLMGQ